MRFTRTSPALGGVPSAALDSVEHAPAAPTIAEPYSTMPGRPVTVGLGGPGTVPPVRPAPSARPPGQRAVVAGDAPAGTVNVRSSVTSVRPSQR
jgi:hypothetical protein